MSDAAPSFHGIHVSVSDMARSVDFYRRIALEVPDGAEETSHVEIDLGNGLRLALSSTDITRSYDPQWRKPEGGSPNALQFGVASREAVDDLFAALTAAGYNGHLAPCDAFWGSRYCEVDDPDGNVVGFHSPVDPAQQRRPGS